MANIWMFLINQGMLNYSYYNSNDEDSDNIEIVNDYNEDEFENEFDDEDFDDYEEDFEDEDELEESTYSRRRFR